MSGSAGVKTPASKSVGLVSAVAPAFGLEWGYWRKSGRRTSHEHGSAA